MIVVGQSVYHHSIDKMADKNRIGKQNGEE